MTKEQAETTITLSALVTSGIYFYRRLVEGESNTAQSKHAAETTARALGSGPVLPLGQWIPAAGVTFLGLALLGAASPSVGGAAALLVGTGAVLGNGVALMADLNASQPQQGKSSSSASSSPPKPVPAVNLNHPPIATTT